MITVLCSSNWETPEMGMRLKTLGENKVGEFSFAYVKAEINVRQSSRFKAQRENVALNVSF